MSSGNGQNDMMGPLWEMGCKEDSDCHQVVGDGASGQGCGPIRQIRVVESQVRVIVGCTRFFGCFGSRGFVDL